MKRDTRSHEVDPPIDGGSCHDPSQQRLDKKLENLCNHPVTLGVAILQEKLRLFILVTLQKLLAQGHVQSLFWYLVPLEGIYRSYFPGNIA